MASPATVPLAATLTMSASIVVLLVIFVPVAVPLLARSLTAHPAFIGMIPPTFVPARMLIWRIFPVRTDPFAIRL